MQLPLPERVSQKTILLCRKELKENSGKAVLRKIFSYYLKIKYGMPYLGEGFRWGYHWKMRREFTSIGNYTFLGSYAYTDYPLVIGDLTMISAFFKIAGNDHLFSSIGIPTRIAKPEKHYSDVLTIVESDVWIGMDVTIIHGIRIGRGSVIAAGSVVVDNVQPYTIVAGVPAHTIKMRFNSNSDLEQHIKNIYGDDVNPQLLIK